MKFRLVGALLAFVVLVPTAGSTAPPACGGVSTGGTCTFTYQGGPIGGMILGHAAVPSICCAGFIPTVELAAVSVGLRIAAADRPDVSLGSCSHTFDVTIVATCSVVVDDPDLEAGTELLCRGFFSKTGGDAWLGGLAEWACLSG